MTRELIVAVDPGPREGGIAVTQLGGDECRWRSVILPDNTRSLASDYALLDEIAAFYLSEIIELLGASLREVVLFGVEGFSFMGPKSYNRNNIAAGLFSSYLAGRLRVYAPVVYVMPSDWRLAVCGQRAAAAQLVRIRAVERYPCLIEARKPKRKEHQQHLYDAACLCSYCEKQLSKQRAQQ